MILNLTQHPATPEQVAADVVDVPASEKADLSRLLTFTECPTEWETVQRAAALVSLIQRLGHHGPVMIGGAPYLMRPLHGAINASGRMVLYSFSERVSTEEAQPDGTVRKVATFRHVGWV